MPRNEKGQFIQSENPMTEKIIFRIDEKTKSMLFECAEVLNMTRTDVIRKGIEMLYNSLK